jgi:aerobic carbon-monoxide dehydrogenase small subunit
MAQHIRFTLNGRSVSADVEPYENAVEVLDRTFGLTGARVSCAQGLCGCCTLVVDGLTVSGCLLLAPFLDGTTVGTIEGPAHGAELDAVQNAFLAHAAFQCGFCTPGFILMTRELLDRHPDPSDDDIRAYLSGNLCRCAAYPEIVDAVKAAAKERGAVSRSA